MTISVSTHVTLVICCLFFVRKRYANHQKYDHVSLTFIASNFKKTVKNIKSKTFQVRNKLNYTSQISFGKLKKQSVHCCPL